MTNPVDIIEFYLSHLIAPDQVFEVRCLGKRPNGSKITLSGYFDASHLREAATCAVEQTANPLISAVYWTLNPLNPTLLARCSYRLQPIGPGEGPNDSDVIRRRWMLIDCDPIRPAGVSATDAEKAASMWVASSIIDWLASRGYPLPVVADSGNGFHLLYRIDEPSGMLPNGDDSSMLIKQSLRAIAARFTTPAIDVDTSVFNAARICKLYGTFARKGDSTADRPHRRSFIRSIPGFDGGSQGR